MNEKNCETCFKIICRNCKWEACEAEIEQIQKGDLTNCPQCGWSPSVNTQVIL